jgi:hypothetical protein
VLVATLPFATSFDPTPSGGLEPVWSVELGGYSTASGSAVATASPSIATLNGLLLTNATFEATIRLPGVGSYAGFVARSTTVGEQDMLWAGVVNRGGPLQAEIWRNLGGVWTLLGVGALPPGGTTDPHDVRFSAVNGSLELSVDGSLLATASDTILGTGRVGMRASAGAIMDDLVIT